MQNWLEYGILGGLLLWSAYVVLRRLLPATCALYQQQLAAWLVTRGWRRLGNWLKSSAVSAQCASHCAGCQAASDSASPDIRPSAKACAPSSIAQPDSLREQPVKWRL